MTDYEKLVLADLLDLAADEFSNHGCNDYPLENNAQSQRLWFEIHEDDEDGERVLPALFRDKLYFGDDQLMSLFADKIRRSLVSD